MPNKLRLISAITVLLAWLSTPGQAQFIDQGFYYKLSTQFRGSGMKLDVFNGGPKNNLTRLEPDQDVSGQFWRFVENADGSFRLSTLFRGPAMCLDIFNGGPENNQPNLVNCANVSGQLWKVVRTKDASVVRLTTLFRGPGMCLDIFNGGPENNQPHLVDCADVSGQLWALTKTDKSVSPIGDAATPAIAGIAEDTELCSSSSNPDEKIAACTRQISSGRWTGRNLATSYINRGGAYSDRGDYERAIADFNEAIRLDPKYAAAYFGRGRAYELKSDFANALSDFRAALGLAPGDTYVAEAVRRIERKLAARTEPKPPVSKSVEPPVVPGQPEARIALIIGNGSYANFGALPNPGNDAKAIAAALNGIGFKTVTLLFDLPRERLLDALKTFAREAEKADWALIYFAGHGLELGWVNYLVPVDAKMSSDRDASFEAIELQKVLDAVGGAKKIGLVILDACRDNPFVKTMTRSMASTRSIGRGLAHIEPEGATLVAYAAKHGQVAEDGAGKNSPFVTALIKNLETPGLEINLLFRKVRDDVMAVTGRRQEPFVYSSLPGEAFYFRKP